MYQSRYHYKNERIAVAIDSLTGELLELVDVHTGENLIKNANCRLHQPFWLSVKGEEEGRLFGGEARAIAADPLLRPHISDQREPDGSIRVTVRYDRLTDLNKTYDVQAAYTIYLSAGAGESRWSIQIVNRQSGLRISSVHFPCINGVWLGESWHDDTLVYPFRAGLKVSDPICTLSGPHQTIEWKWQEYAYRYEKSNPAVGPDPQGLFYLESKYTGDLSMTWMDYYGGDLGLYVACYDTEPHICSLRADTFGESCPGMNFSCIHYPYLDEGQSWTSPDCAVAVHDGDWHEGARRYRAFRERGMVSRPRVPEWFERSPGLIAHYDFKYQNGGIVHRYEDIPGLLDEARELGINHLLFSGWHRDGFDHGFPNYYPDEELGTQEELRRGIADIRERGGHVCFYVNARIANSKYAELKELIQENAVRKENGQEAVESYGREDICFVAMCINAEGWPEKLRQTLRFITEDIGADGVYLDQLAMAAPCHCFHPAHHHHANDWSIGYQKLLADVQAQYETKKNEPMSLIHEGVSDAYGGLSGGQLIQSFFTFHTGSFPEMYKYTFPEQILVDMVYPQRHMAMRPVHVGQISTKLINKTFVTGCYFWIYDLVEDNTFTRDPKQYAYLKQALGLRSFWLETFGQGVFRDTDLLTVCGPAEAKRFDFPNGRLYACSSENEREKSILCVPDEEWTEVRTFYPCDGAIGRDAALCSRQEGRLHVTLPSAPLCLIWLSH